jgi:YXWGXW repeat-containing protein
MQSRFTRIGALAATVMLAASLTGCVVEERTPVAEIVAPMPPPPPRYEVVPPPPRPAETLAWRPGHWHWNGREYVWVHGGYMERPRPAATWDPGHWDDRGGRWVWVDGHWR